MPGMGERAYAYAKVCGIIGKSFVGKGVSKLGGITRLAELDRAVFPDAFRDLPERELLADLEKRLIERSVGQIKTILSAFNKPPELLVRLLRNYEYSDLKNVLSALASGEAKCPPVTSLDRFQTIAFDQYPDLKAMLQGTEFAFILTEQSKDDAEGIHIQTKLDQMYYRLLWESLLMLPPKDRAGIETILGEEIALQNAAWTLRFRTYYNMGADAIQEKLILLPPGKKSGKANKDFGADARAIMEKPLDIFSAWENWSRVGMLNQEHAGEIWRADPRYFQNSAADYLYGLARHYFHYKPFSINTAACFIKLKLFEEDLLTSLAEGLGLGMSSRDIFALLEVAP